MSLGTATVPLLSFRFAPGEIPRGPSVGLCHPWEKSWVGNQHQPEGSIPWKAGSQQDREEGGCSSVLEVVLSRLDAGLCSYAWNVL